MESSRVVLLRSKKMGRRLMVGHGFLVSAVVGSNPAAPKYVRKHQQQSKVCNAVFRTVCSKEDEG